MDRQFMNNVEGLLIRIETRLANIESLLEKKEVRK